MAVRIGEHKNVFLGKTRLCPSFTVAECYKNYSLSQVQAGPRVKQRLNSLGGAIGRKMGTQNFFNLDFEQAGLIVVRKTDAYPLRAIARRPGGRDPRNFTCDGVTLDVIGKRQQNINVIPELVFAGGGYKHPPLFKKRNVGSIKRCFFLDRQLNNARSGSGCGGRTGEGSCTHGTSL